MLIPMKRVSMKELFIQQELDKLEKVTGLRTCDRRDVKKRIMNGASLETAMFQEATEMWLSEFKWSAKFGHEPFDSMSSELDAFIGTLAEISCKTWTETFIEIDDIVMNR